MSDVTAETPDTFPSVVIDEEGFPQFGELRVADPAVGREILQNIYRHESGVFYTRLQDQQHLVEAFDEPLVLQHLHSPPKNSENPMAPWRGVLPFGSEVSFLLSSLRVDEWDRFHGRLENQMPFVFSRKAQAQFFENCDDFEDESFTFAGHTFAAESYWPDFSEGEQPEYWTEIYHKEQDPGWNLHAPAPALADVLPRLKMPKSRILVLGCGEGEDAAFFANAGHVVTAVDFSEEALKRAREKWSTGSPKGTPATAKIQWQQADALDDNTEWYGSFDMIFEHTCYCAINPSLRSTLVKNWRRYLTPQGQLMGVFFCMDRPQGPPFGGTEWELRQRLKKDYQFLFWGRWKTSAPARKGKEVFVLAQRMNRS